MAPKKIRTIKMPISGRYWMLSLFRSGTFVGMMSIGLIARSAQQPDEPVSPSDRPPPAVVAPPPSAADVGQPLAYDPFECESCCCSRCFDTKWTIFFTQTADYGTSLALPITLTPLNTLIAPLGNPALAAIPTSAVLGPLGLLDNLGILPGPIVDTPTQPVFPDDFQFQTTAGLLRTTRLNGDDETLSFGYSYYQNLHPKVEQLDLQSHTLTSVYTRRLDSTTVAALDYNYNYYFLDGFSYVDQNRVGASALKNVRTLLDVLVRADYSHANFQPAPFLNSDNYSAKLEGYRYSDDSRTDYLSLGYSAGYSDAANRSVSYQVNSVYAVARWLYGDQNKNEFKLTFSYSIYDFFATDFIEPGVQRRDDLIAGNVYWGRQIANYTQLFVTYNYLNSDSTVIRNQYHSNLISAGLTFRK